MPINIFTI